MSTTTVDGALRRLPPPLTSAAMFVRRFFQSATEFGQLRVYERRPYWAWLTPNVQAKRATTVARQARAVENATASRTGPGGLPLALRLSKGLGLAPHIVGRPLLAPS